MKRSYLYLKGWKFITVFWLLALMLSACQPDSSPSNTTRTFSEETQVSEPVSTPSNEDSTEPENISQLEATSTTADQLVASVPTKVPTSQPTLRPTLAPDDWQDLPVFPTEISARAREI